MSSTLATRRGSATAPRHLATGSGKRATVQLALWVAAAWALPVVAQLLHVAWVIPLVVLVGTASLLSIGRTLLDRVVVATALLYGAVCVAGFLLSVWPWQLHPVPAGGVALTALVAFARLARRRPSLPMPALTDGLSVAAAGFVGLVLAFPPFRHGTAAQISLLTLGEDGIRHFIQFDTIRQLGGYLFLQPDVPTGMALYPHGWHFFFALFDGSVRSSASDPGGLSALNHYLAYAALTYAAFALAVIWGLQRLAEPLLTPSRRLGLVALGVTYLLSDETFQIATLHYTPQIAGLALVVVLAVVLARPPARTTLSLWLISALLVGVGFTYSLYLPPMVLVVLVWLYARRRHVRRHPFVLAGTLLAVLLSALPLGVGLVVAEQARGLPAPTDHMGSVDAALVFAAVAGAGMLKCWRVARWRVLRWGVGSALLCLLALYAALLVVTGASGSYYYANKLQNMIVVLLVLTVGASLALLPAPQRATCAWSWRSAGTWPAALRRLVPGVAVSVALAAGSGLVVGDSPWQSDGSVNARGWAAGIWNMPQFLPHVGLSEARREVDADTLTVVMAEEPPLAFLGQILVSGLRRQYREFVPALYTTPYRQSDFYDNMIEVLPHRPILIVVDSESTRLRAERLQARHPDRHIAIAVIDA